VASSDTHIVAQLKLLRADLKRLAKEAADEKGFNLPIAVGGGGHTTVIDLTDTNLLLVAIDTVLDAIKVDTGVISAKDFATEATLAAVLSKILVAPATEAKQDDIESSLNTLVAANASNFALNIAEMGIQTTLNIAAIAANAVSIIAGQVIATIASNASMQDIEDAVDELKASNITKLDHLSTDIDQVNKQTKNQITGLYTYSARWTATSITGLHLQFDFGAADSRVKIRTVVTKQIQGVQLPSLEIYTYDQDIALKLITEFGGTDPSAANHNITQLDNVAQVGGGQTVFRSEMNIITVFPFVGIYDVYYAFEVTRDTLPTITQFANAHTESNKVETIVGLDE